MNPNYWKKILAALAMMSVTASAFAQYVWLDEHGVKQFSDISPPSDVPQNRILKQPHHTSASAQPIASQAPADAAATEGAASAKTPMTTAEKNADFNKRKLEKAEKDKKADEDAKRLAAKTANCERAANYLNSLKSGMRIATTDSNGERSYLSDENRAKEQAQAQSAADGCK